jgi:hypothetical protein
MFIKSDADDFSYKNKNVCCKKNRENAAGSNCVSIVKRDAGEKIIVPCLYMEQ